MSLLSDNKYLEKEIFRKRNRNLQKDFRSLEDKYEDLKRKNQNLSEQLEKELNRAKSTEMIILDRNQKLHSMKLKCENQRKALASNYKKIHDLNKKLVPLVLKDQKSEENSMNVEKTNSKLLEISEENKKLRIENEKLINEKNEKQLEFDEVFKNMIRYSRKMKILENEKVQMSLENENLRTVNENLELTVEDFENQEKIFKKKMMQFIQHAPNVDRCAKKGSKRKALDEAYINKRRKQ